MKFIVLAMVASLLTGCVLTRDYVDVEYISNSSPQRIVGAEEVEVAVNVNDVIVKDNVVCKFHAYGSDLLHVIAKNDIFEVFRNAIIWELQERGFLIGCEGSNLNIELCKFSNDFKPEGLTACAASEAVLNVTLRKNDGMIVYSKTIIGCGDEKNCYLISGENVSLALDRALNNAVQKLVNDPDFICALITNK